MSQAKVHSRVQILRQVLVFQFKLVLDAFRDLTLSPLSLVAALADLLRHSPPGGLWFDRVLALGRRSEHMIDLWRSGGRVGRGEVDLMVDRLELLLRDEQSRKQAPLRLRQWAETTLEQLKSRPDQPVEPPTPG